MRRPRRAEALEQHLAELAGCRRCPRMVGPVVVPRAVASRVYLVGQAPGPHEGALGRPFAWTAGKTLFRWFSGLGLDEEQLRASVYLAAVCRCFPGKDRHGGDRVPDGAEMDACRPWMEREVEVLAPELVIPVGRLAIERFLPAAPLVEIIGKQHRAVVFGRARDLIPLPHPSGASTWFKREPGLTLLRRALRLLGRHPAWQALSDP